MTQITHNLMNIRQRIVTASERYERNPDSVQLLAVSKRHSARAIVQACEAGQRHFGESFVGEAIEKQAEIRELSQDNLNLYNELCWHFIGKIQSNKAKLVAQHFDWVHSLDRDKVARRLNQFRGPGRPLNVFVQVNLSNDPSRAGVAPDQVADFVARTRELERLNVRGLMAMAPITECFDTQCAAFATVKTLFEQIRSCDDSFDHLSMGMSSDLEAAIANGATWVRIGTDVFGKRPVD